MKIIRVQSAAGAYPVICGRGALRHLRVEAEKARGDGEIFLLSSPRVWRFWGREILRALPQARRHPVILFDDAESSKRLSTVEDICRKLARAGADRHALLVAVGGGVVGDVAGFAAATYLRGVKIAHVATTIVAQADSAIGGKTGVDLPEGKNLAGAFHPPRFVICDPMVLRTLAPRQFRSGLFEIIKYGVIGDAALFAFLEERLELILHGDAAAFEVAIGRGARQKASIVSRDEHESGLRQLLNFGHTIGHALESLTNYRYFLHGEAVGWGMLGAALIAAALDELSEKDASRIARLVARCGRVPALPDFSARDLFAVIATDKKSRNGRVRWVLPQKIGAARWGIEVPDRLVALAWKSLPDFMARARKEAQLRARSAQAR